MVVENECWIDVTITDTAWFISDWTHTMQWHWKNGNTREYESLRREFIAVNGKSVTYYVRGLGLDNEKAKAIAVRYHIAKEAGHISKHRLD